VRQEQGNNDATQRTDVPRGFSAVPKCVLSQRAACIQQHDSVQMKRTITIAGASKERGGTHDLRPAEQRARTCGLTSNAHSRVWVNEERALRAVDDDQAVLHRQTATDRSRDTGRRNAHRTGGLRKVRNGRWQNNDAQRQKSGCQQRAVQGHHATPKSQSAQ
jgi:hypothetical protein